MSAKIGNKDIESWFSSVNEDDRLYLLDIKMVGDRISLKIDSDEGIFIDECAKLNRSLNHWLEERLGETHPYRSEVSSPGVDFPLTLERQYKKNIGRKIRVVKEDMSEKTGKLTLVNSEGIVLEVKPSKKKKEAETEFNFAFADIKEAKVVF